MSAYQAPIPPVSGPTAPRVGGYDRDGKPQDTVTGRITLHHGTPVPPPSAQVHVPRRRSMGLALLLAVFLGPLGLMYSAPVGAMVTSLLMLMLAIPLSLFGVPIVALWMVVPLCVAWAFFATAAHNGAVALAHAVTSTPRRW